MSTKNKKQIKSKVPIKDVNGRQKMFLALFCITIITFIALFPSLKNEFTNWDDPTYVLENNLVKSLSTENIKSIFSSTVSLNYHPLTMLSLAIDYHFSELKPGTYHTTNLIFHLLNTLLVFWFVFLLSKGRMEVSLIVSILFGIHPMHVESVAWISERKDVLYTFFFMASLITYHKYVNAIGKNKTGFYFLILLLFILSLFSKAVAVVLPMVMLLIDYYSDRKTDKNVWLEKIPFFILSLIFGVIAYKVQSNGAIAEFGTFTIFQRLMFASYGMLIYLIKFFYPYTLSTFYPYPNLVGGQLNHLPTVFYLAPFILLVLLFLLYLTIRKTKIYVFGFLFFFFTIALVLQFISVGQVIMADRYAYIPYIGLSFMLGEAFHWLQNQTAHKYSLYKKLAFLALLFFIGTLSYTTFERCKVWKNTETLWTDVLSKYPQVDMAYKNRGNFYAERNQFDKALNDFNNCIALNQRDAKVYSNRGNIYGLQKKFDLSLADYSTSITLQSKDNLEAYLNRAITLSMMKEYKRSFEDFDKALAISPNSLKIFQNRAYSYLGNGDFEKSIKDYDFVISQTPKESGAYFFRAYDYFQLNKYTEAIRDNSKAIELNPAYTAAYFNRSVSFKSIGNFKSAMEDALKAKELGYNVSSEYLEELKKKL